MEARLKKRISFFFVLERDGESTEADLPRGSPTGVQLVQTPRRRHLSRACEGPGPSTTQQPAGSPRSGNGASARCDRRSRVIACTFPSEADRRAEISVPEPPPVIHAQWRCEDHNRCAGCGQRLADWWLSAYPDDDGDRSVPNVAAYSAFGHRCRALTGRLRTRSDVSSRSDARRTSPSHARSRAPRQPGAPSRRANGRTRHQRGRVCLDRDSPRPLPALISRPLRPAVRGARPTRGRDPPPGCRAHPSRRAGSRCREGSGGSGRSEGW